MNITVVIASIRESSMQRWLQEWQDDLGDTRIMLVEDNPDQSFNLDTARYPDLSHYDWRDIEQDLGANAWIIPRRTSAIKSYGFLKAYREGADAIWTLDDDCYPEDDRRGTYLDVIGDLLGSECLENSWWNTLGNTGMHPRGYPYEVRRQRRPVMIHHGLWSGIPDLDGITALKHPDYKLPASLLSEVKTVPQGFFPMCGMNLAFRREMTPAMYFMLMGSDASEKRYPFDRFDDIWAGLFAKRICDHLGYAVLSGAPSIVHTKESDPQERVIREAPGIRAHEKLWQQIEYPDLNGCLTVKECYRELAQVIHDTDQILPEWEEYWDKLADAMSIWADLF